MNANLQGKDAAHFIMGYFAGVLLRSQSGEDVKKAGKVAREILEGGAFGGPLAVWEMENVANNLATKAAMKAKAPTAP